MPVILHESFTLIWGSLVNVSIQVAFLTIFSFLALKLLSRSSAALRHQLLVVTLFCGMLMPLLNLYPTGKFFVSNRSGATAIRSNEFMGHSSSESSLFASENQPKGHSFEDLGTDGLRTSGTKAEMDTSSKPTFAKKQFAIWSIESNAVFFGTYVRCGLVCLWFTGVLACSVRFLFDQWQLRKLELLFHRLPSDEDLRFAHGALVNAWFRNHPVIMCSVHEHTPMTWGLFRPKVLLPSSFMSWPALRRRTALLHELAHVRRWDSAWQCLSRLFCVLFWFHPGAWWMKRQLNALCEKACDDQVLASGERASDYADALLFVAARTYCTFSAGSIAMARDGLIADRIEKLFDSRVSHSQIFRRATIANGLLAVFATLVALQIQPCRGFALFGFSQRIATESTVVLKAVSDADALGDALAPGVRLQFGTKRLRPGTNIDQILLSPNEDTIVSHGGECLTAWDATTGKERWRTHEFAGISGTAYGHRPLVFAENGKSFFTVSANSEVIEWGIETPNPKKRFAVTRSGRNKRASNLVSIDIVGNGERLAIGNADGLIVTDASGQTIFQVGNAQIQPGETDDRLGFHGDYTLVRFSPDKQQLACVFSEDPKEIRMLDAKDGRELRRIALTDKAVRIHYSPGGSQLVVTERDSAVRLYDVSSEKLLWSYVASLNNPYENYTSDVVFSPDGSKVVAGATNNHLYVLDAKNGKELGQLIGHNWYPWSLAFSADSQRLFSSGWDGTIRRWDMRSMQEQPLEKLEFATSVIAASPNGKWIAVAYEKGRIALVSVADGKEIASLPIGKVTISQVAFSVDSQLLAVGAADDKKVRVSLWNVATANEVHQWDWELGRDPHSKVEALVFSPNGSRLAAAVFRQSKAYLWDVESKNQIAVLQHNSIYGMDFDANGERLLTVGWDSHLREWNAETGELEMDRDWKQGQVRSDMYAVSCSSVGDLIATAHMNATIKIWNREDMSLRSEIKVGDFSYGALAFSKDGLWLASGTRNGNITIWDPFTGEKALDVGKHESSAYTVCFGSDLRTLISGGDDGMGFQWDLRRGLEQWTSEPDVLWEVLRSGPAADAFGVIQALSAKPEVAVELIARKLKPVRILFDPVATPDRAELFKKLVGKNEVVEYSIAARRAVTILAQTEGTEARTLLQELADRGLEDPVGRLAQSAIWGKQRQPE